MQTEEIKTAYNSSYPKVAVQWLNQALFLYQSLRLIDSKVLRNRHLRVAAKRCETQILLVCNGANYTKKMPLFFILSQPILFFY